ncbi:hypothetical protein MYSTI_05153 [Myxococcus stipitatus DSM 14675]|uniref:DUF4168 domain-containing protein n=1 Tax=Myxococcus stipitatus (strain DSM 14675 / JCM 12634 / Mx s8) TaxID=1278073 RepID=L7UF20_MYXSD|nr:hypothetical protein [Myxococcus stipitatus]AGC46440.1 hypothetical protein MYSTI_05153 [Myxococcus stipitatus DSM 14675]
MSRPISMLVAALWILPGVAGADDGGELTPEKVEHIRRDEATALQKVDDEFGNRKSSEMSNEERGQAIRKTSAATAAVLEKHGVTAKEYERFTARMGQEGNERAKAEGQRLDEQAKTAKAQHAAAAAKAAEEKEVSIQQGFDDENPVELESLDGDAPVVEIGIPVEDSEATGEEGGTGGGSAAGGSEDAEASVGAQAAAGASDNEVPVEIMSDTEVAQPAAKPARKASAKASKAAKVKKKVSKRKSTRSED